MLFYRRKFSYSFIQKNVSSLVLLMIFSMPGYSQKIPSQKDSLAFVPVNPFYTYANKKTPALLMSIRNRPAYKPFAIRKGGELMHWPNYPLTAAQIIARQADWQRRNNQTVGERVAGDIIKNSVNSLIYGRKSAPATVPKF